MLFVCIYIFNRCGYQGSGTSVLSSANSSIITDSTSATLRLSAKRLRTRWPFPGVTCWRQNGVRSLAGVGRREIETSLLSFLASLRSSTTNWWLHREMCSTEAALVVTAVTWLSWHTSADTVNTIVYITLYYLYFLYKCVAVKMAWLFLCENIKFKQL